MILYIKSFLEKKLNIDYIATEHKKGAYILKVANHVVAVVDGIYYDTWDSGYKSLYGYYEKDKGEKP